ncbi:Type VI secretion lipoprotein [compost metagenome]
MNRTSSHTRSRIHLLCALLLVPGCSMWDSDESASPVEQDYRYVISLKASEDINPDLQGRPMPVLLNFFELRSPGGFEMTDYFDLRDNALAHLGSDFIGGDKLMVWPGSQEQRSYVAAPGKQLLGVIAGYQQLEGRTWRVLIPFERPAPPKFYQSAYYRLWDDDLQDVHVELQIRKDGLHVESAPQD